MLTVSNLKDYPKSYVQNIKSRMFLTDDESIVFDLAMRDMSAQQIADRIISSTRTVFRRKKSINRKLEYLDKYEHMFDNITKEFREGKVDGING